MSSSLELFVGRLGRDPELLYTEKLKPVCHLSVAVKKDASKDETIWHKVVVWGKQAELCSLYLKKGKEVFVRGQKQSKSFKSSKGEKGFYEEVLAKLVGFTNL